MEVDGYRQLFGYPHSSKQHILSSTEERNSYRFGTTWGWVNDDHFFWGGGVNYPFNANNKSSLSSKSKISQNKTSIPVKRLGSGCDLYFTQSSFWGSINTVYSGPLKLDLLSKDCSEASHSSRPWIREQILDLCISTHCLHNRYQNTPWKQTIKHKHTQSTSHGFTLTNRTMLLKI